MEVRNLRPYAVEIVDPNGGSTYDCAARPGVVDVPDTVGRSLLKQADNWTLAEEAGRSATAGANAKGPKAEKEKS